MASYKEIWKAVGLTYPHKGSHILWFLIVWATIRQVEYVELYSRRYHE